MKIDLEEVSSPLLILPMSGRREWSRSKEKSAVILRITFMRRTGTDRCSMKWICLSSLIKIARV